MARARAIHRLAITAAAFLVSGWSTVALPAGAESLVLKQTIALGSVRGRLDHLDIDLEGGRLFVAALGADSVEVVDLHAGQHIARIERLHEPQGVLYLPAERRLIVANGEGGGVQAFDGDDKAPAAATASALDDADNLRLDPASGRPVVGYARALAILDPRTLEVLQRVELSGHPEAFQVERIGRRIYANVPIAGHIAVVDRESGKVVATWTIDKAAQNFPMALDEPGHRLFVATRRPALLLVYDTRTGQRVAELTSCGDADDLFFDRPRRRIYALCGEGAVDVVQQRDEDHYEILERIRTVPGARTGLFVPELSTLFVAAPASGNSSAELRVYGIK